VSRPVNLNKARKARARTQARAQADENAVRFGLTKAQRQTAKANAARDAAKLDGKKRQE